jgi:putative NIF3 family GTP cyclohydrolase 1 type 2
MVLCHHGMYWWFEEALVWVPYERAQKLINNDIALYACHLPLDAHEEVGNNIGLLKGFLNIFWLSSSPTISANVWIYENYTIEKFWTRHENEIWFALKFENKVHISSLQTLFSDTLQLQKKLYNFWNLDFINSVAFVSWWWWSGIKEAKEKWFDLFITWEAAHHEIMWAKELWQSIMLCWHRETEKIWPKLLAYHLRDKFDLEIVFLDEKY